MKKRYINKGEKIDFSQHEHDSLINNESFSNNINFNNKQIYSEERKVVNTDYNMENNFEVNPADFMTNKREGKLNINMNTENEHDNFYVNNHYTLNNNKIKLEDGISINIIKSHGDQRIKKFFHILDFEIYVIKVRNFSFI